MTQLPCIAIVGGGAGGTLTAIRLLDALAPTGRRVDVLLVDPQPAGRGIAYATSDPRHRLNVPAAGMSAYAEDPEHFLRWMRRHVDPAFASGGFGARMHFAEYLRCTLDDAARAAAPTVTLHHITSKATALSRHGRRWRLVTADGAARQCDAVVLAVGTGRPSIAWAPPALARSPRFVADPWAAPVPPPTRDAHVVLVGASLTMADMAMSWGRAGTTLHAISRHGLMPLAHRADPPPRPAPPAALSDTRLRDWPALRHAVMSVIRDTAAAGGDWRSVVDSLRPITPTLWQNLSEEGRAAFLQAGVRRWNRVRHRVEPSVAAWLEQRLDDGSLQVHAGEIVGAIDGDEAVHLQLSGGRTLAATTVINCTGPCTDVTRSDDPLMMNLLESGIARPDTLRIGLQCDPGGRVVSDAGPTDIWAVGPLRQGALWESTAIPEIRVQAAAVAAAVVESLPGTSVRRRPRDPYGLPLTTTPEAAARYVAGLDRILRVQSGATELIREAVALDPGFAVGHAASALLGAEWGADVDVAAALRSAQRAVEHADEREARFVDAVTRRVVRPDADSAATLISYVRDYPEDALAVSVSVPTIAFGGATELPTETYALVDGLAQAYGDDWWYRGLLAFFRQEQGDYEGAARLADLALAVEPASGHAVHARTHVYYETGRHAAGLEWLDRWIRSCGRDASHRAHFSWHAALHEIALGRDADVARRYHEQLAPPAVRGVRALIDSAALLWRGRMDGVAGVGDEAAVRAVLDGVPREMLDEPSTPFVAMHAAIAQAAVGDCTGLARLRRYAERQSHPAFTELVAPLADALCDLVHGDADRAVRGLRALGPLDRFGGSAAQREVIEETLLFSAIQAGQHDLARAVLDERLGRRPSARDSARLHGVSTNPTAAERRRPVA